MQNDSFNEILIVKWFKSLFKPVYQVSVGDVGIYRDSLSFGSMNDGIQTIKYDTFTKVEAVGVYDELIEVKIVDIFTMNSTNKGIKDVVESTIPKYINPKHIKWEIKPKTAH